MLREKSCGVVPYRIEEGRILYLVISSALTKREHWEFPKGGVEEGEREIQTALRELDEETGVREVQILPGFREPIRYIYRRPEGLVLKQVVYFIGRVRNPAVTLRLEEAKDFRWADYEEARRLLRHVNARALLERSHAFIAGRPVASRLHIDPRKAEAARERPVPPDGPEGPGPAVAAEEGQEPPRRRKRRRRSRRKGQRQGGGGEQALPVSGERKPERSEG